MSRRPDAERADSAHRGFGMTRWERFSRLGSAERGVFLHAMMALPLASLALRVFGFRRTQQMLTRLSPGELASQGAISEAAMERARLTARMVDAAAREGWPHARCLERSLVAWWLMRRQCVPTQLRIGVRQEGGDLRAHAWVEVSGVVLNDNAEIFRGYKAFARAIESAGQQPS